MDQPAAAKISRAFSVHHLFEWLGNQVLHDLARVTPIWIGRLAVEFFVDPKHGNVHGVPLAKQPEFVRQQMTGWYRERAASQLKAAANRYCQAIGADTPKVLIRDFSRRWGSANENGRLAFNWRIVMAPRQLIDYVAAHEACHLIHNDHSADFWRLLERIMPDYESRRVRLAIEGPKFQL